LFRTPWRHLESINPTFFTPNSPQKHPALTFLQILCYWYCVIGFLRRRRSAKKTDRKKGCWKRLFWFTLKIAKKLVAYGKYTNTHFSQTFQMQNYIFVTFTVFRALFIQGYFLWLSSPIGSGVMTDHRIQSLDCSWCGPWRVENVGKFGKYPQT